MLKIGKLAGFGAVLVLLTLTAGSIGTAQKVITVCPSGCDYTSIQAAILAAPENSTIQVKTGTYQESLTITKPLSLVGEGPDKTIIQGGIIILATEIVNITGFMVNGQGIQVQASQTVSLLNNLIDQSMSNGILIVNSAKVTVGVSTIQNSKGLGIVIVQGSMVFISDNTIRSNGGHGISLVASQADLYGNMIRGNRGCGISADSASQLSGGGNIVYWNLRGDVCGNVPSGLIVEAPQPEMAFIPAGSFQMGDYSGYDDEKPVHTVFVSAFFMDKFEVTKALWDEVASWAQTNGYDIGPGIGSEHGLDHPVTIVSWYTVVKWANARSEKEGLTPCYYTDSSLKTVYRRGEIDLSNDAVKWSGCGYRLPTEAEWEKAARGGLVHNNYPWGNEDPVCVAGARNGARFDDNNRCDRIGTAPVGMYSANGYGLYDMAGNVEEWVWDWYHPHYYSSSPGSDPRGPDSGSARVLRGGSWYHSARGCRVSVRHQEVPHANYNYIGFRLVRPAGQ